MTKNYFLIWILLCCFSSAIAQNYVPIKIASGFNADVIANGVGSVTSSTTHTFDLTAFNLVSRDFVSQAGNSPLTFGLPLDGKIVASNDSNLIFQLNPYSQNNSLRLIGWGSTGDLVFETPENATKIEILTAAGNAAGSAATFSGEVRFTDNTIQSFNGLYAEDWYSYGILSPTVAYGMGRVRASDNVLEKLNDFPRLFGAQINISVSNYYKKISSIHVFKTTSTPEVLHIMAITVKKTPDCFQPTNVQVNNISTNQASISWSAATVSPNLGYEYEIRTSDLPGSGGTGLVASGSVASNTLLNDITNLVPSTVYFVYVRSKCTATSFSEWSLSKKFETKCLPPTVTVSGNSICKPGVVNLTATTTDGVLQWYDSPTSQTVLQSGGSYTTPALSATKSYWVDATSSNFISLESGKEALHTSANDVNTFVNWGVTFDLTHDVYLKSTDVFVGAPGTLNVAIYDSSGIEVFSTGDLTLSALGTLSPVTIPLNVQLKAGYGYRMLIKSFKDIKLYRDSFVAFPYKDVSEILSVSSGFFDGYTRDYYYYFYNFVFEKGCKSLRKEVVATVSNSVAPTTTLPTQTFCFESGIQLKDLRVTGSNIKWYNAATGGNQWSETALATDGTTYYASQTINGCESEDRLAITTKIEKISVFSVDQNITYNYKDVATALTAKAATGNKLYWYLTATGTGENETAPVPNTSAVGVQKYWVREVSPLGCLSDAVEIIVTVNPVELTVTADPHLSKVFGATDPVFTYTATGFVGTDGNALFTGALARAAGEDVGGYAITKGTLSAGPNYSIRFISDNFTIEKATISGTTFNSQTVTYDGTAKSLVLMGLPSGASVSYTNNHQIEAGTYTVIAAIAGGVNYNNTIQTAVLTIEKASISGTTFNDQTVTYDGTTKSLVVTGLPTGTSATYTNNDQTEAGTYTVTATIAGGMNYNDTTQTAVLTIEKASISGIVFNDQTVTYDGVVKSLALTGTLPTGTSVTYTNNDQTEAGTYTVTAAIAGGVNYENAVQTAVLTIEKATISGTTFNDQTVTYDSTAKSLVVTGLPTGASVTYTNNNQTEVGIYTVIASILGGTNYIDATQTAVLTIEKATISGVVFNDKTLIYDGTVKTLALTGTLPTGTGVTYTNNDQTEVGIYTVTASITGGANYQDTTQTAVLTIEKAAISGVVFSDQTLTYDGTAKSLVMTGLPSGTSVTYTNNDQTEVGTYTVTATIVGGANYEDAIQTAVLKIEKAAISGTTFNNQTVTYDGTVKSLVLTGLPIGTSVAYTNNDQTEAGTYTVTATIAGGANYENATQTAVLKIEKASISGIVFNDQTMTYDGTVKSLALSGTLPTGTGVSYTNNDQIEAGTYTVIATIAGGTNYTDATQSAVLTIKKAVISGIVFNDQTMTFDGTTKSLALTGTLPTGASVTYVNNSQTQAGTYTVKAEIKGGTNYEDSVQTAVLTIKKATISGIVLNDQTVTYDGAVKSLALTGTLPSGVTVTYTNNNQTQAGIYTVTALINGGNNYENTTKTAVLTIDKAAITSFVFSDKTVTYDGTVKSLVLTGLPTGATVSYANNNQTEAGIFTVTAQIDGGANYISTTKTAVLTIEKANLKAIVFNGDHFVYDGFPRSLAITGTLPTGAIVSYTNNAQTNVGVYTVLAQIDGGKNYNNLTLTATLTIDKAIITGIAFSDATVPYSGTPKSLLITGSLPTGASVSYQNNGQINLGVYAVTATILGGANYSDLVLKANLTIEKGVVSNVYLPSATYTYDGTVKSLAISGNTIPAGVSVTYQNNDQIDAGIYTVTALIHGGGNYHDRELTSVLTIKKAIIDQVNFADAKVIYDGTVKALSVSGSLPAGATVTYQNNDNVDAGLYTVIADIEGGKNYAYLRLTAKLTIEKAPQIIYFEPLPVLTLEEATDFQLSATSNSKLEIKYSYTFDSSTPAAQVSEFGWVTLEHPGVVLITANQSGDKNHNAAQPISRELRIESQDATIHNLWIGEQLYSNPTEQITYLIDCDNLDAEVKIKIQSQIGTTIDPGQEFVVNIIKPGVYKKVVSVTAENGKASKDYEISIVKPFPFHYIVEQKYNNVLLINNNPKTNGGFKFVKFEWYKNGQLIGEEQVYTAGNKATDLLDPKAIYSVVLTTDSGEVIPVCGSSITIKNKMGIKLYPNPVEVGDRITLTISEMQPEWKGEALQIYDMNGRLLQQTVIEGVDTEIQLSTGIQRGVYMAVFKVKGEQKAIKFVVK